MHLHLWCLYTSFADKVQIRPHVCMCLRVCLSHFSCVWCFASLWTIAWQAPLSMGFSSQEYRSGLPFLPLGHLPGMELAIPVAPELAGKFFTTEPPGKPLRLHFKHQFSIQWGKVTPTIPKAWMLYWISSLQRCQPFSLTTTPTVNTQDDELIWASHFFFLLPHPHDIQYLFFSFFYLFIFYFSSFIFKY